MSATHLLATVDIGGDYSIVAGDYNGVLVAYPSASSGGSGGGAVVSGSSGGMSGARHMWKINIMDHIMRNDVITAIVDLPSSSSSAIAMDTSEPSTTSSLMLYDGVHGSSSSLPSSSSSSSSVDWRVRCSLSVMLHDAYGIPSSYLLVSCGDNQLLVIANNGDIVKRIPLPSTINTVCNYRCYCNGRKLILVA